MSDRRVHKPDQAGLDARASAYVAALANGATEAEQAVIDAWIDADPHHAVSFARMQSAWETAERLRASPSLDMIDRSRPADRAGPRRVAVLAMVAVCGLGAVLGFEWMSAHGVARYRTGVGERRSVTLSDGSVVELNTATTLTVAMRKAQREVRLIRGEAQFKVAHDTSRPFYVDAASARLRAVGTAFNVRIRDALVELTVTQGIVAVGSAVQRLDAKAPHIAAGDGAVIDAGAIAPTALGDEAVRQRTAWQRGVIELQGETLAQVVEEFNRYQPHPIVIGDPRLANLRLGGRFQVAEAAEFLRAVSSSFPIDVIRTGDGGHLLTLPRENSSDPDSGFVKPSRPEPRGITSQGVSAWVGATRQGYGERPGG